MTRLEGSGVGFWNGEANRELEPEDACSSPPTAHTLAE